ncbi:MAG: tetratricopeptide (TPR) repeat protein [Clostridium sp.]|jgi:tetratricopeptide (TPR) repeat protein
MDKSGKIYVKAMNKYNDGYIDKALALCEKSISVNITNAAALNLKGILYYLKGDLESAKKMWSINYKRNNDKVSKKYIKDSITDKEKLQLYVNALELIRKLNISGALEILKKCENSHFNFINVNNHISICYIKQGEYDKALHYVNEVLKVDKKNTQAIRNKKTLIEYGNLKREINYKKVFIASASIFLTVAILMLVKEYMYKSSDLSIMGVKIQSTKAEEIKSNIQVDNKSINVNQGKAIENKPKEMPKFPQEQFKESIKSNNMEQIIGYVNKWKNADLEINDKLLLAKGEEIIKNDGVVYFYEKGIYYINDKKFIEAQKYLLYALPYSKNNYLQEHIIYMLALTYKSISDFENTVKYYELTLKQFPNGSYTEEVIYNLILINKDIDIDKAKSYADKLVRQFPHSQYYNSIVKEIIATEN